MIRVRNSARWVLALVAILGIGVAPLRASMTDLGGWSLVQDPADGHFTASTTATTATLVAAGGPIPSATDIGHASVIGSAPALSTSGFA